MEVDPSGQGEDKRCMGGEKRASWWEKIREEGRRRVK